MTPTRSAFGASPPGRRPQRPGKAGSAAATWWRQHAANRAGMAGVEH